MRLIPSRTRGNVFRGLLYILAIAAIAGYWVLKGQLTVTGSTEQRPGEREIMALSSAIESYKLDEGMHPRGPASDSLDPDSATWEQYTAASLELYQALSGDSDADGEIDSKRYLTFKRTMLRQNGGKGPVTALLDPHGRPFGYSTLRNATINEGKKPDKGYNPTFDLWSTGGADTTSRTGSNKWVKNW